MKQLSEQQIVDNWNKLIKLIKDTFPEDYPNNRREKLLKMYHYLLPNHCDIPSLYLFELGI